MLNKNHKTWIHPTRSTKVSIDWSKNAIKLVVIENIKVGRMRRLIHKDKICYS